MRDRVERRYKCDTVKVAWDGVQRLLGSGAPLPSVTQCKELGKLEDHRSLSYDIWYVIESGGVWYSSGTATVEVVEAS